MAETVVQLRDVTKNYRRDAFELKVLQGITLDVEEGDFVGADGALGLGQEHAAEPARGHRPAEQRRAGRGRAAG